MTLIFYVHKDDDAVECNIYCKQKYKDQIIKYQEDAEKYLAMLKEAPDLVEFDKLKRIIERLKNFFNADNVLTKSEYKQKILGEEK